jgi:hypothetical protein
VAELLFARAERSDRGRRTTLRQTGGPRFVEFEFLYPLNQRPPLQKAQGWATLSHPDLNPALNLLLH